MDMYWLKHAFDTLTEDIVGDEDEEDSVEQAADGLDLGVAVGILLPLGLDLGHVSSHQPNEQSHAVEEHVESI